MALRPSHLLSVLAAATVGFAGWWILRDPGPDPGSGGRSAAARRAAPVEIAPVQVGDLVERRVFGGTLIPRAQFLVAPKAAGRVEALYVDLGDDVAPGAVLARLDDDEFEQAAAEADAEVAVTRAQVIRSRSALDVAQSTFDRISELQESRIASGSELDIAAADLAGRRAEVDVAEAQVKRAEAALAAARVRLAYATVRAPARAERESQPGGDWVVARRFVDEGATVAVNQPVLEVVDLATVRAVLFATERDFARLTVDQTARVRTDAFPGQTFEGRLLRVAPVFEETSRQIRVEVEIPNPERRLRPGMFVQIEVDLGAVEGATLVPEEALVRRDGGFGLFVVDGAARDRVRYAPVETGITADGVVQVFGERITGEVVTLGQQLLEDGSAIRVPRPAAGAGGSDPETPEPAHGG